VLNQTQADAVRALKAAGFKTQVRKENSDTIAKGRVISTSPPENSQLQKGSTVAVVVSSGRKQVAVPSVVGKQEDVARNTLEGAGLKVTSTQEESKSKDPGTVLRQSPSAGGKVDDGSTVALVVAKAPPDVDVPDVVGNPQDQATQALKAAGFKVRVVKRDVATPDQDGVVQDQSPGANQKLQKGKRVTITVGRFNPPLNPEGGATPTPTPTPSPTPVATP
jgi:serine/threonine-protein kinase